MRNKNLFARFTCSAALLLAMLAAATPASAQLSTNALNGSVGELVNNTLNNVTQDAIQNTLSGGMLQNAVTTAVTAEALSAVQDVLDNVQGTGEIEAAAAQISSLLDIDASDAADLVQSALDGDLLGSSLENTLNNLMAETVGQGIDALLGGKTSAELMQIISGLLGGLNGAATSPAALLAALNDLGIPLSALGLTEEHLNALLGLAVPLCPPAGGMIMPCESMAFDPSTVTGPVINVSSIAELLSALNAATGGETIMLAPGDYTNLNLSGFNFPSNVTIAAANPSSVTLTDAVLRNVSNVTLANLTFTSPESGSAKDGALILDNANNVNIIGSIFQGVSATGGSVAADALGGDMTQLDLTGFGSGKGLDVRGSNNVTVSGSTFHNFSVGSDVSGSTNTRLIGNSYSRMTHDAMDFDGVNGLLVEGNYVTGMNTPKGLKHNDVMQFRQFGTPSSNIMIRNNVLVPGATSSHVIFMGDNQARMSGFQGHSFINVNVVDNQIVSGHAHSIAIYNGDGVNVTGNSVLRDSTLSGGHIPTISIGSRSENVNVTNNIAHIVRAGNELGDLLKVATPGGWVLDGQNTILPESGAVVPPVLSEAPGCSAAATDTATTDTGTAAPATGPI